MTRREKLQKLIESDASDPFLHFGLAMEWVREGNVQEAEHSFDRCVALDANYTAAYYHKGKTLIGAGRSADARVTLLRGIEAARAIGNDHALGEMMELLESAPA